MDLSSLSKEQLTKNLRSLQRPNGESAGASRDDLAHLVQELQVQRLELEMQNRALRETEVEVESALQRYSDLYDHLPIGYVTLTRKGRIAHANLTAAGWLRRDRAQLVGTYLGWFLDAFDAGRLAAHLDACVQGGNEQTLEVVLRLESGLLLTVQLSSRLAPPDADGERAINTAITNISKLQQAQAVVNDMAREQTTCTDSLSHQLRAPLATIGKFAQAMLQDHAHNLSGELKNMIQRVECAAMRMDATVQHLLEYCCVGDEAVALDPVNLEELMQHVVVENRTLIQRRRAEITVERPLPCVRGASLLLGQVIANVLTNAMKHTLPEKAPRVRVSARRQADEVILKIADEGTQVDAEREDQNFRVFERLHHNSYYRGEGVGFAIVRHTIELMNGRVWIETEAGKGACFNIGLPAV